jgi:hydroxymethylbilane synthase
MEKLRITGRNSRLSLLQIEKVKQAILRFYPGMQVDVITKQSLGDQLKDIPLQTVEGTDFFTNDFFDALENGEADIAVHSLKDMSGEHFFGGNEFALIDRDDVRDLAIFNPGIEHKLAAGEVINIGTCSPRRETMALEFLQKALPQTGNFSISTKVIRGNIEERLRKLHLGEYEGIILATAGINRLLNSGEDQAGIQLLLKGKKLMLLPLFECVPAPCQGAIVAEALPGNTKAVEVLKRIDLPLLKETCSREKELALQYGKGSMQEFGVMSFQKGKDIVYYSAGKDSKGQRFEQWEGLPEADIVNPAKLFNASGYMGRFYDYAFDDISPIAAPIVFVSSFKAIHTEPCREFISTKKIWASGTKTWIELAKKGIWVEGSADGLGMETLIKPWSMPLFNYRKSDIHVLTNHEARSNWQAKGWKASASYSLIPRKCRDIERHVSNANFLFWTSYGQFCMYKDAIPEQAVHACLQGETATLLKKQGISPVLFPTLKSFIQWQQNKNIQ